MSTAIPVASHGTDVMVASPTTHPLVLVPAATTPQLSSIALDVTPLAAALQKVQALETWLGQELIEREDATRVALTALLSAQHMALIGPPGTAKSLLILLLSQAFQLRRFVTLISPHSKVEDLFGPLALSQLPNDIYRRLTTGYLPWAQIAFLDELFNVSGPLAQATLRLVNEREFDNGNLTERAPLISVFGASNQLPQTPDMMAFFDRLTFRVWVDYVSRGNFPRLMALVARRPSQQLLRVLIHNEPIFASQHGLVALAPPPVMLGPDELYGLMWAAAHIPIPQSVLSALDKLYDELDHLGIRVSDRRWQQSQDALRAHALLDGRGMVTTDDISIYAHMFWNTRDQRVGLARVVERLGNPLVTAAIDKRDQARSAYDAAIQAQGDTSLDEGKKMTVTAEAVGKLKTACGELEALMAQAQQQAVSTVKIQRALDTVLGWRKELSTYVLG